MDIAIGMDWDAYEIYHPGVSGPLDTLSRRDARRAFNQLMEAKPSRIKILHQLLRANGLDLDTSDAGVQALNDWFRANVEEDPAQPGRLMADWYSVVNDIGLFLGEVMILRSPGLRWEFYTWGKKSAYYQRHVIMGFSGNHPRVAVDIDMAVAVYGHRVVRELPVEEDAFCRWLANAAQRA